jgi:hypothetical protein
VLFTFDEENTSLKRVRSFMNKPFLISTKKFYGLTSYNKLNGLSTGSFLTLEKPASLQYSLTFDGDQRCGHTIHNTPTIK